MKTFMPYARQVIEDDDVAAVSSALRADFLTTGPTVDAFERAFADKVGAKHAVACNSGTAALHLSTMALGLGPGDWVVVPSMTFLATANAVRYVGAEVQFADVDPDQGLITQASLNEALDRAKRAGRNVKAISVVHLAGRTAPLASITALAKANGVSVIEDACHALGTTYCEADESPNQVGSGRYDTLAAFSFHPVKAITVGEGGMVTTNDAALAEKMRRSRNHGMTRNFDQMRNREAAFEANGTPRPWYYEMQDVGFNYRLPDILCALGLSQLAKLDRFTVRRRQLAMLYDQALMPLAPLVRPVPPAPDCTPAFHLYVVLIDFEKIGVNRYELMTGLVELGIGTQVHYIPVHRQPYYRDRYEEILLPGADAYYDRALSLPLFPSMTDTDVLRVVENLAALIAKS